MMASKETMFEPRTEEGKGALLANNARVRAFEAEEGLPYKGSQQSAVVDTHVEREKSGL